ncbi:hypothetical protein LBW87_04495 [Herbaspirillum seropedicae]|nr:hypothetical protein [Herbaspirillum sp. alder98]
MKEMGKQADQILGQHRAAPASMSLEGQCHHSNENGYSHDVLPVDSVGMDASCAGWPSPLLQARDRRLQLKHYIANNTRCTCSAMRPRPASKSKKVIPLDN